MPVYPADIRFTIETLLEDDALEACFIRVKGDILCCLDEDDECEVQAGELDARVIDVYGAEELGYSAADIFDQTEESYECYTLLFDDEEPGELRESFTSDFGDPISRNILLLHRLEVLPDFRHAHLGLAAIGRAIDVFGAGCGYAVLKAMPLQFEYIDSTSREQWFREMRLGEFPEDKEQASGKLQAYYALLGFRPVAGTPWMALNLVYARPRLADILRKATG